jgi:hypothetical protein
MNPKNPLLENTDAYRTTFRCIRMTCKLTLRLLGPIERCPRCRAQMTVVALPRLDLDAFLAAATDEVVAGFGALLSQPNRLTPGES